MRYKLLDEHTSNLKAICDMHGIRMILQNYPYYNNPSVDELDIKLREIAGKLNIFFVDHYQYFTEVVGKDRWKRVQTYSHINNEGYALMAENLCNFIISKGLLQN
jgi:lysophospholipase L1-like esterase